MTRRAGAPAKAEALGVGLLRLSGRHRLDSRQVDDRDRGEDGAEEPEAGVRAEHSRFLLRVEVREYVSVGKSGQSFTFYLPFN